MICHILTGVVLGCSRSVLKTFALILGRPVLVLSGIEHLRMVLVHGGIRGLRTIPDWLDTWLDSRLGLRYSNVLALMCHTWSCIHMTLRMVAGT